MELAPGETLAERLKRGKLPVDEALAVAKQIAEALEAAHEKGIVHRDLKPGNVKVTPDGNVKVLGFGLAKAWGGEGDAGTSSADPSESPTLARTGTAAGLIVGTAAYMSPEMARGKPVDKRADIWAFGLVLFEMLTGRPLFAGETVSDVLASVLKTDPDWSGLPGTVPSAVRGLLRRCLERDPRRRLHDVADARLVIEDALAGGGEEGAAASAGTGGAGLSRRLAAAAVAVLALASAGAFLLGRLSSRPGRTAAGPMRLAVVLPADDELRVVTPRPGARFELAGPPQPLFPFPIASGSDEMRSYDVTRDGARILAVTIPAASRPRQIEIVTDWTAELSRLVPPAGR
jgi:hypothetical protein